MRPALIVAAGCVLEDPPPSDVCEVDLARLTNVAAAVGHPPEAWPAARRAAVERVAPALGCDVVLVDHAGQARDVTRGASAAVEPTPTEREWSAPVDVPTAAWAGVEPSCHQRPGPPHRGVDVEVPPGTLVRSVALGVIQRVRESGPTWELEGRGSLLRVDHGDGLSVQYDGLPRVDVGRGETVAAGQVIGAVGGDGCLHVAFEAEDPVVGRTASIHPRFGFDVGGPVGP